MNVIAEFNAAWFGDHFGYVVAVLIVVVGVAVGFWDLVRLSPRRIWAIGAVGFRESMRRRVLWVTPLAMLGIVAVTQLSHPVDEQDAIRQATKYCLFATGLVVVVATLILACTNLPKEIDNRVIYTIVTKPATRLDIVLGKVVAFARTSAVILLVMGIFSYAYLHVMAAQLASSVQARLRTLPPADPARATLQQYATDGLLNARSYVRAEAPKWGETPPMQIYARAPQPGDKFRWIFGNDEQNVIAPFRLPEYVSSRDDSMLEVQVRVAVKQLRPLTRREVASDQRPDAEATTRATTRGVETRPGRPKVSVTLLDANAFTAAAERELMDPMHPVDEAAMKRGDFRNAQSIPLERVGDMMEARVVVPPKVMQRIRTSVAPDESGDRRLFVMVQGATLATQYGFGPDAVQVRAAISGPNGPIKPPPLMPMVDAAGNPLPMAFRGRMSSANNQQLRGDDDAEEAPVAVFEFHDAPPATGDEVGFEFRTRVERSGVDPSEVESNTRVEFAVRNRKSWATTPGVQLAADSEHPATFRVPRAAVEGGEFDVLVRCHTPGHFVGVRAGSVAMIASTQWFAGNLLKSLAILWMLSVLVVIVSIFCSTFVSWPIAVVLSLVILLGRWCVAQLGEQTSPGQIATELFGSGASNVGTRVFTDTVTALNKMLAILSKVLPNLDYFRVTADIERGVTIPYATLFEPLIVLGGYGVPILFLSYLFLRKKEAAP